MTFLLLKANQHVIAISCVFQHGSFYHRNTKYLMQAHETFAASGLHEIKALDEDNRDFNGDAMVPPDDVLNGNAYKYTRGAPLIFEQI